MTKSPPSLSGQKGWRAGERISPVKVRESTEAILQGAFAPLKNAGRLTLRHQFLVPELPITMAPKLDNVMSAECQSDAKSTDTALARLQALTLDAVGPLTDLLEKVAAAWYRVLRGCNGPPNGGGCSADCSCTPGECQYPALNI